MRRAARASHAEQVTTTSPPPAATPAPPPAPHAGPRPVPAPRLEWLTAEVADWRRRGLLDEAQAAAVLALYTPGRRASLARLLLVVGACFVGVGLLWLVAANLAALSPTARFAGVVVVWLVLLLGTEARSARLPGPVVAVGRLAAVLAFGAVVFQAAQSLQVPAWEPRLLGVWAAGALLQAYAVRSALAVVVGVSVGTGWLVWAGVGESATGLDVVLLLGAAGVGAVAVGALHEGRSDRLALLGVPWREAGALLVLAALFGAALPVVGADAQRPGAWAIAAGAVALALAALAAARSVGQGRLEPAVAALAVAVATALVLWEAGNDATDVDLAGWLHAGAGVLAYLGLAVAVAAAGTLRDSGRLTGLATVALVAFTTVQAFAVFARVVEGAWLFLLLGAVLVGTGWLTVRAQQRLARTLEEQ